MIIIFLYIWTFELLIAYTFLYFYTFVYYVYTFCCKVALNKY